MRKFLLMLFFGWMSLWADEIQWVGSYDTALSQARAENKNIMVLITTTSCRWCRKLESKTLTDPNVIRRLNRDYVSVHLTRDVDIYPRHLDAKGVPTTYFLNRMGQPIIKRVMGYWNVEDYLSFLDDVDYKLGRKQY